MDLFARNADYCGPLQVDGYQLPLLNNDDDLDRLLPWQINADKNGQQN